MIAPLSITVVRNSARSIFFKIQCSTPIDWKKEEEERIGKKKKLPISSTLILFA